MENRTRSPLWKWTRRVLLALLTLLVTIVVLLGGWYLFDLLFGPKVSDVANTSFSAPDGTELIGYLAVPDEPGPHPGVLLIHEWWGLNEGITVLADALAEQGYVVFAPDAYRGEVTRAIPRALALRLGTPEEQIHADLDAGLAYLMAQEGVDTQQIASMGFCFGGGQSLLLGLRQPENIVLTVLYYGDVVTEANLLEPLMDSRGVLGIFGEEDQQIFVGDVLEFEAALNTLDIPNEITIYPGVGHAFLNEENFDQPGAAGDAWQQTLAFLAENFN